MSNKNTKKNINKKWVIDKKNTEIIKYITKHYIVNKYGDDISPIMIQKSLYFLFVLWVNLYARMQNSELSSHVEELHEMLFEFNFEAWEYGPVDDEVYKFSKSLDYNDFVKNIKNEAVQDFNVEDISSNLIVVNFIKNVLSDVFTTNDFDLVDRSHEDVAWKKAYQKGIKTKLEYTDVLIDYGKIKS